LEEGNFRGLLWLLVVITVVLAVVSKLLASSNGVALVIDDVVNLASAVQENCERIDKGDSALVWCLDA
jgi:hypothetical protein